MNPAADPNGYFSAAHHQHLVAAHPDQVRLLAGKIIVFLDSITDLTRQAMAWAKTRPEAFSDRTGKPDTRGAYGLMAREVIGLLKHLQHAPGPGTLRKSAPGSPRAETRRGRPRRWCSLRCQYPGPHRRRRPIHCRSVDARPSFEPDMQALEVCRDAPAGMTPTGTAICARKANNTADRHIAALGGEARSPGLARG